MQEEGDVTPASPFADQSLRFSCAAQQLIGDREYQNDSYAFSQRALFLSDGAGSQGPAREFADIVCHFYRRLADRTAGPDIPAALVDAPRVLAQQLRSDSTRDPSQAATLAGALLADGLLWTVAHGDSAVLVVRGGELLTRTRLHNGYLDNTELGLPADETARGVLTRSLSGTPHGESEIQVTAAREGDVVVLLSDGFAEIAGLRTVVSVAAAQQSPDAALLTLVDQLRDPPRDNATCVMAMVVA